MEVLLRYSNHPGRLEAVADVLARVQSGEERAPEGLPAEPAPTRTPQTHLLSDDQAQAIFLCYRAGTGPRELARRHGLTERAVKYLLKKHGVQQQRSTWRAVTEGRV